MIHDTHGKTTPRDLYFPQDLHLSDGDLQVVQNQLADMSRQVGHYGLKYLSVYDESQSGYHVFGIDVMITSGLEVKILEINSDPGLNMQCDNVAECSAFKMRFWKWIYKSVVRQTFPFMQPLEIVDNNIFICDIEQLCSMIGGTQIDIRDNPTEVAICISSDERAANIKCKLSNQLVVVLDSLYTSSVLVLIRQARGKSAEILTESGIVDITIKETTMPYGADRAFCLLGDLENITDWQWIYNNTIGW